jgi:hypothetical protein
VNEAMHVPVSHYTEALARAGAELTPRQIMVLSFRVVIYILFRKDMGELSQKRVLTPVRRIRINSLQPNDACPLTHSFAALYGNV